MNKSDLIYIAGHKGLIGSAILRRLEKEGYSNIVTRTRSELDLRNSEDVFSFFQNKKPQIVFLAAGRVGGIMGNKTYPADFITENLSIQLNVIQAAQKAGVKKFIFFGSSCMYPRESPQPMKESQLLTGVPESTSMAYAMAKLAGVEMCLAFNRQFGKNVFIPVIPNNAYGPNDDFDPASSHVLSGLLRKFEEAREQGKPSVGLWGTGSPRREFVFSDDIADACLHIVKKDLTFEHPVNMGVGQDCSIKELAETIQKIVGFKGDIDWDTSKPDGAPRKLLDSGVLFATGWRPKVNLEDGIRKTYEWFTRNKEEVLQ